jgi:hypothetical protein
MRACVRAYVHACKSCKVFNRPDQRWVGLCTGVGEGGLEGYPTSPLTITFIVTTTLTAGIPSPHPIPLFRPPRPPPL